MSELPPELLINQRVAFFKQHGYDAWGGYEKTKDCKDDQPNGMVYAEKDDEFHIELVTDSVNNINDDLPNALKREASLHVKQSVTFSVACPKFDDVVNEKEKLKESELDVEFYMYAVNENGEYVFSN
jgi:hypothetical protein